MFYEKHFVPLESDPKIFTQLMHDLGASESFCFVDVYNLETDFLATLSRPVLAFVLILPPCSDEEQKAKEQTVETAQEDVIWFNQTINNACGLYAILHAVCNNPGIINSGTILAELVECHPFQRATYLKESEEVEMAYGTAAQDGQSSAPPAEDEVDYHYICLVKSSDYLFELDGDREGPIKRGALGGDDVLTEVTVDVINKYIHSEKDGQFSLLALVECT